MRVMDDEKATRKDRQEVLRDFIKVRVAFPNP